MNDTTTPIPDALEQEVVPIDAKRQRDVSERTAELLDIARHRFSLPAESVPVHFNLKGRCAGMFRVVEGQCEIRYNPWIFARHYADNFAETIPHEVAHYVVHRLHGRRRVRPHGSEWKNVMESFGVAPVATCRYDLSGVPQRRIARFNYACGCRNHELTSIRHNRIVAGKQRYHCRSCGQQLLRSSEAKAL